MSLCIKQMLSTCLAERHVKLLQYSKVHLSYGVVFALDVLFINLHSQIPNVRHTIMSEQHSFIYSFMLFYFIRGMTERKPINTVQQ